MTDQERAALEGIDAKGALAALTEGTDDDRAVATEKEGFLAGILQAVQSDPSRGGSSSVRDIATALKQARDNVASFVSGGASATNENADLQAQIEQAKRRAEIAETTARVAQQSLSVFQGAGDIGYGMVQNNYMLHPADPAVLRAIGDAATAGIGQQPSVTSPRQATGL